MADTKNVMTADRLNHPIGKYFMERFLRRTMPKMLHEQFAVPGMLPSNTGDTVIWRRMANPTAQTTPIDEVNDPTPSLISKTDISAKVKMYGAFIKPTTWGDMINLAQDKRERTIWLGDQHGITMDTLCRDTLAGTGSSTTCSNGSDFATQINKTDLATVVTNMLGQEAMMIESPIKASTGIATVPVRDAFICITHVNAKDQIEKIEGFTHFTKYANFTGTYKGEWGAVDNVRFILTTNAYTSGSNYYATIIAQEAYGRVNMPSIDKLLIFHPASVAGSALELYSTYGWRRGAAFRILNDSWIHQLIFTLS